MYRFFQFGRFVRSGQFGRYGQWFRLFLLSRVVLPHLFFRLAQCRRYRRFARFGRSGQWVLFWLNPYFQYRRCCRLFRFVRLFLFGRFGRWGLYLHWDPLFRFYPFGRFDRFDPCRQLFQCCRVYLVHHGVPKVRLSRCRQCLLFGRFYRWFQFGQVRRDLEGRLRPCCRCLLFDRFCPWFQCFRSYLVDLHLLGVLFGRFYLFGRFFQLCRLHLCLQFGLLFQCCQFDHRYRWDHETRLNP